LNKNENMNIGFSLLYSFLILFVNGHLLNACMIVQKRLLANVVANE